jgi:hypothetical protein
MYIINKLEFIYLIRVYYFFSWLSTVHVLAYPCFSIIRSPFPRSITPDNRECSVCVLGTNENTYCLNFISHFTLFIFLNGEGPRRRRYRPTAASRLLVQPYYEDDDDDYYFLSFSQ